MKRSEMIEIIKSKLEDSTSFPSDKIVAEYLLDAIEEAGMLPPCALIPIPHDETPLVPGDFKNDEGVWCTPKHEWIPEEWEKKE